MTNNYDKIANYYDTLSRMVFFKSQVNAQVHQLQYLPVNSSILIVGGGTGWILEEIAKVYSSGIHIVYVEISAKMIALSKERNVGGNTVSFVNLGVEDFSSSLSFDVIWTPFLFDNFSKDRAEGVFNKLLLFLKDSGYWFFVDFSLEQKSGKWWKSFVLKLMYWFFKLIRIVEASSLINMDPYFKKADFVKKDEAFYYAGFIKSVVYQR